MTTNEDKAKATIKAIERMLYEYSNTDNRIKAMEIEIELIEYDYCTLHGASDNKTKASTPTNQINSNIEDSIINKDIKLEQIRDRIKREEFSKRMIENAMNALSEDDRKFIEDRYFKKISPKILAKSMYNYGESWVFKKGRSIIKEKLLQYIVIT